MQSQGKINVIIYIYSLNLIKLAGKVTKTPNIAIIIAKAVNKPNKIVGIKFLNKVDDVCIYTQIGMSGICCFIIIYIYVFTIKWISK